MILRPYQQQAVDSVLTAWQTHQSALAVAATGTGKTIIFAKLCLEMLPHGRCMILAHREELIAQAADKIRKVTGIIPDIEMAERRADESGHFNGACPIVVSSVQTQVSGGNGRYRMNRFLPNQFSLLIIDEAHHAAAKTYRQIVTHYRQNPNIRILGVTATPDRSDELALGQIFDCNPYVYDIGDAINDGWLVPIKQQYIVCKSLDFSAMRTTAGDLNQGDLAATVEAEQPLHEMVGPTLDIIGDRKLLFFAVSVEQAMRTTEIFNRHRAGMADCVFGSTPKDDRKATLDKYRDRLLQVLVNVGIATEGFDDPDIDIVAVGRPTKSRSLYAQMIGRGTRPTAGLVDPFPTIEERQTAIGGSGKPFLHVLDFVGNSGRHKLISAADILGGKALPEDVEAAKSAMQSSGRPENIDDMIAEAKRRRELAAEERRRIRANAKYTVQDVNPFGHGPYVPQAKPPRHWFFKPATERQVALLRRRGVNTDGMTIAQASAAIDAIAKRENWKPRPQPQEPNR